MTIKKYGYRLPVNLEVLALADPGAPEQKGHYEPVTPTEEQIAQHARAKAALEEIEENPYIEWPRMDDDIEVRPLETERWVPDETHEEYMERLWAWWEGRS